MTGKTIQVQSVLYLNDKESILTALKSLERAAQINFSTTKELSKVTVFYGDASPEPLYSDEEIKQLQDTFSASFEFKYIFFNENTGSAKGQTMLARKADTDYVLVMNPDVVVSPRVFTNMLAPFKDEKLNAGVTEGRQTPIEHAKEYDRITRETDWVTGAFILCPREIFMEVGGFDYETFFMYCDDVDFSWRVRLTGKKLYYCPEAVVFHAKSLSNNGKWQPTKAEVYYSAQAAILMAYKWSNPELCDEICKNFLNTGDEVYLKAVKHFKDLKAAGKLPKQLDPEHKVAKFVNGYYTEHRYKF